MANGLCPYILQHISEVTKEANPMYKVRPYGFTSMLYTASSPAAVKYDQGNGHFRSVQVKYRKRATVAQTDTSESCAVTLVNAYNETSVSVGNVRQYSFHVNDETMAAYCSDASNKMMAGIPPTPIMNEVLDQIFSGANAILHGMNQDLLGLITWGRNITTGANTSTTLNISKDVQVQELGDGIQRLLADYAKNDLTSRPQIVGQGIFLNHVLMQPYKGLDQFGIDTRIQTGMYDFWNDADYDTTIGTNQIGVFEPNSIQIVEYMKYQGFKAMTIGADTFMQIALPYFTANSVVPIKFDLHLRYHPCAETLTDAYTGAPLAIEKGWQVILSKNFGLFQVPTDAYRNEDPSFFVNGALRYTVTNECETCS